MVCFRRWGVLIALPLLVARPATAQDIGSLAAVVGTVEIVRDGRHIFEDVTRGVALEVFDYLAVGDGGAVEIALAHPGNGRSVVSLGPDTGFVVTGYARAELLIGTVSLRPAPGVHATGRSPHPLVFELNTESASVSFRDAEGSARLSWDGDLLVTVDRGIAICTVADGRTLVATTNRAVRIWADGSMRNTDLSDSAPDSTIALDAIATRYRRLRREFDAAYRRLVEHRDILDEWMRKDQHSISHGPAHGPQEPAAVAGSLDRAVSAVLPLHSVLLRIRTLPAVLKTWVYETDLSSDETPDSIVESGDVSAREDVDLLLDRLHEVRYVQKLYRERVGEGGRVESVPARGM